MRRRYFILCLLLALLPVLVVANNPDPYTSGKEIVPNNSIIYVWCTIKPNLNFDEIINDPANRSYVAQLNVSRQDPKQYRDRLTQGMLSAFGWSWNGVLTEDHRGDTIEFRFEPAAFSGSQRPDPYLAFNMLSKVCDEDMTAVRQRFLIAARAAKAAKIEPAHNLHFYTNSPAGHTATYYADLRAKNMDHDSQCYYADIQAINGWQIAEYKLRRYCVIKNYTYTIAVDNWGDGPSTQDAVVKIAVADLRAYTTKIIAVLIAALGIIMYGLRIHRKQ